MSPCFARTNDAMFAANTASMEVDLILSAEFFFDRCSKEISTPDLILLPPSSYLLDYSRDHGAQLWRMMRGVYSLAQYLQIVGQIMVR